MEKIRLLIVDDVPQTRKDIIRLLYFEDDMEVVGEAAEGAEALKKISELLPDVVLMDINMPQMDGITATEKACQLYPNVAVVIISIQGESEYLKKAMVAGARDYLVKPLGSEEMASTIRSVHRQQKLRLAASTLQTVGHTNGLGGQPHQPIVPPPQIQNERPLGHVSVVFSGKGGVGKTTVATNLAVVLAQNEKKKVALVDYDLQFGDISVMLNLSDGRNISDLVQENEHINADILDSYMIRHFAGIDILPAPLFPQDAEYVSAEHTDNILRLLKKNYDYIIVDTASAFHEINLQAMDVAEQILLVVTRDIATIKNAKTSMSVLESLNYRDKIRIVLNRSDQDLGVEVPDLEKGLEITVAHQVTGDEKAIINSINKGVPVVISQPAAEIAKSFRRLGERMVNGRKLNITDKQSKSIITRMFSL